MMQVIDAHFLGAVVDYARRLVRQQPAQLLERKPPAG
jgi:hypothetical protein